MDQYIIVAGTNRREAVSFEMASIYKTLLAERGVNSEILDLQELPPDFTFSALYEQAGKNSSFNLFRDKMAAADKFVFIVPEYNGSFPGVLKTFIDGLKFPQTFSGKKCALVGISSGSQGGGLALSHLTDIFNYCGMNVLAIKPRLSGINQVLEDGKIKSDLYVSLLNEQVDHFIKF